MNALPDEPILHAPARRVPLSLRQANAFIAQHHRHNGRTLTTGAKHG